MCEQIYYLDYMERTKWKCLHIIKVEYDDMAKLNEILHIVPTPSYIVGIYSSGRYETHFASLYAGGLSPHQVRSSVYGTKTKLDEAYTMRTRSFLLKNILLGILKMFTILSN